MEQFILYNFLSVKISVQSNQHVFFNSLFLGGDKNLAKTEKQMNSDWLIHVLNASSQNLDFSSSHFCADFDCPLTRVWVR